MTEEVKRTSYKPLWWLIALCAFPYVAGTVYYQYHDLLPQSDKLTNYGFLVQPPREISAVSLELLDGNKKSIEDYRRKWLMLYLLDGDCDEACQKNIYFMRQVRKAMAQDRFRISRLLVLSEPSVHNDQLKSLLSEYPGLEVAYVSGSDKSRLNNTLLGDQKDIYRKIMLVDPMGNYMMQYPVDLDAKKFLKDVKRLLDVSQIG